MENEEKGKNIGYKAVVIVLIALLICSNVIQFKMHNDTEKIYEKSIEALAKQFAMIVVTELIEIDQFTDRLNYEYIYVKTIEPIGFINYSLGNTGFRTILYNITFNWLTEEEANGSIEVKLRNYTNRGFMTFDVAVANDQKPMVEKNIYKMYYIYNAFRYYNVIYYEKIETGRID